MNQLEREEQYHRCLAVLIALVGGCAVIATLTLALPVPVQGASDMHASAVLLDRGSKLFPLTIQNAMWLLFAIGLGELWVRFRRAQQEADQFQADLLPDDETVMYRAKDLVPVYRNLTKSVRNRHFRLQRVILRVVQQFQISKSIDQANSLMNSSLELVQHEIELKYNMLRYLVWLIPTTGFIGTIVGIALALSAAGDLPVLDDSAQVQMWFGKMTANLGVAFNTTLLALVMAAILMLLLHLAQSREEGALNEAGQFCLDRLINRLYED